jgi:hypothetical protein
MPERPISARDIRELHIEGVVDDQRRQEVGCELGVVDVLGIEQEPAPDHEIVVRQGPQELLHLP